MKKKFIKVITIICLCFTLTFCFLGGKVLAAQEILNFGGFSKYQGFVRCEFDVSSEGYYIDDYLSTDVAITVDEYNNTDIQTSNVFSVSAGDSYSEINFFTFSVPNNYLSPTLYISNSYINKPIVFTAQYRLSVSNLYIHEYYLSNVTSYLIVSTQSSDSIPLKVESTEVLRFVPQSDLIVSVTYSIEFSEPTYIYGFWFKSPFHTVRFEPIGSGECKVRPILTLSPLILNNDLTTEDISDGVASGISQATGGNNYTGADDTSINEFDEIEGELFNQSQDLMNQSNVNFDISSVGAIEGLVSSARGISNLIERAISNIVFFNPILMISLGVGGFAFLFGLGAFAIHQSDVNKERSARKQQFKNRSNYKGGK